MDREFADILRQIGCTDGLHVPVANEENKQLQIEVEEKLRRKADFIVQREIQVDKLQRIQSQVKNLKSQKEQNQQLIVAHRNQYETEQVMLKESEFDLNKTQKNIRDMNKRMQQIDQSSKMIQEEIKRSMKQLDHLKSLVEWGEEARKAWQEELAVGERDNDVLSRFKLEDDIKFKEMELKRQRLKADVTEREGILNSELSVLITLENQLEQVSRLFRRAHKEHMSLISYWESAVRILQRRESDTDSILQELEKLKLLAQEKFTLLAGERKFYETQCNNNEELRRMLDELNSQTTSQRQRNLLLTETTTELKSEVSTLRGVMSELGNTISNERSNNVHLVEEVQKKTSQLQDIQINLNDLKVQLQNLEVTDLTVTQRNREIENIIKITEKENISMQHKVDKLKEKIFEKIQELDKLKNTSKLMAGELQVFSYNKQDFERRAAEIEKLVIKKEQTLYDLDMQIVTLESQLERLQGGRTDEEKSASKTRILELEEELRKKTEIFRMVSIQLNKIKIEQIRLCNEVEEETDQLNQLTQKRNELMFLVEGGEKELRLLRNQNTQSQVTVNMLRLRVDQRQKALAYHDSQVCNLERERLELENALRERKTEIGLQMDLMTAKKRTLEEEKSELKKALEHLHIRINQLQKKHDIVMDSLRSGESGENFSVAHIRIKNAQEKYELQEIGDNLDSKIKKAENEIPAMENTLRVISAANDCYKRNLDSIDSDSPEMQEKKTLEEKLNCAKNDLKERQLDLKKLNIDINELELSLVELSDCEESVQAEWKDRDVAARILDKELEEQQNKLVRADKLLQKVKKDVRQLKESRIPILLAEKDIEVRELQDINQSALQQLAELATRYAEVGPVLGRYLGEKGLKLPLVRTGKGNFKVTSTSTLSTTRSLISEGSHVSWSSGTGSHAPSIVTLDPDFIQPASGDSTSRTSSTPGRQKKKKYQSNETLHS